MTKDFEIASKVRLKPIREVAAGLGLSPERLFMYGEHIAKVKLEAPLGTPKRARYVVVSGINPASSRGEGKTTVAIGLAMALCRLGKRAILTLREPSMGPVFGIKGGATGGGFAQILPMEEINLHFTGDFHAVTQAQNLAAAVLGAHRFHGNALGIEPRSVWWPRVMDLNERQLRHIVAGIGGELEETRFEITPASETMAILALAKGLDDLRLRLGRASVGFDAQGGLVTLEALGASGAMAALLKHALLPNLVQTIEHTPCLVHAGPFANIAHGASSVVADTMALALGDIVVTEAGFGTDCGLEKLAHIKVPALGTAPELVVLVVTLQGLLTHGNGCLKAGLSHLQKHIENVRTFGLPCLVALNVFAGDAPGPLREVEDAALGFGASGTRQVHAHAMGSAGVMDLAELLLEANTEGQGFRPLYTQECTMQDKLYRIATTLYGADDVRFSPKAVKELERIKALGLTGLPVNIAKTPMSLSHDPQKKGVPKDFIVPIEGFRIATGAGFITAFAGNIQTMPGLPRRPAALGIDVDGQGNTLGLF